MGLGIPAFQALCLHEDSPPTALRPEQPASVQRSRPRARPSLAGQEILASLPKGNGTKATVSWAWKTTTMFQFPHANIQGLDHLFKNKVYSWGDENPNSTAWGRGLIAFGSKGVQSLWAGQGL